MNKIDEFNLQMQSNSKLFNSSIARLINILMGGGNREAGVELLRIIAMFMILILHADYFALGAPTITTNSEITSNTFFRVFFEALSIGSVDIFVLISGYFCIKPSFKSFANFLFQCFFFSVSLYVILILVGVSSVSIKGVMQCLYLTSSNWFIKAYICLYILSPVLNSFISNANQKNFKMLIYSFFIFQTIFGHYGAVELFSRGYSTLSFIGLYLLAAYVRKYNIGVNLSNMRLLTFWCVLIIFLTLIQFVPKIAKGHGFPLIGNISYINPIVIMASLSILLLFLRFKFKNKFIVWVASSSFAVYLLHCNPTILYEIYVPIVNSIYNNNEGFVVILLISIFLLITFIISILFDQLRKLVWYKLNTILNK